MNPFGLDATGLMVWGLVAHLIADWPLQNDWMAANKGLPWRRSISGLAPAFVHAGIHGVALGIVFGYWPGMALALSHLLVDTRKPVAWWSQLIRQTQPEGRSVDTFDAMDGRGGVGLEERPLYDIGIEVRFWTDQVFHIACIAVAALVLA